MFRTQYKPNKIWVFVCEPCLISAKENNLYYKYGGPGKNKEINLQVKKERKLIPN